MDPIHFPFFGTLCFSPSSKFKQFKKLARRSGIEGGGGKGDGYHEPNLCFATSFLKQPLHCDLRNFRANNDEI